MKEVFSSFSLLLWLHVNYPLQTMTKNDKNTASHEDITCRTRLRNVRRHVGVLSNGRLVHK